MMTSLHKIQSCSGAAVYAKAEYETPTKSAKFRIGDGLIAAALIANPGATGIVDATSGGTGSALAYLGTLRSLSVVVFMPEGSRDRAVLVTQLGGQVILVPGGMPEAAEAARSFAAAHPEFAYTGQFDSEQNVEIHRRQTAPEIMAQLGGQFRTIWVVAGSGTGGTLTGVSLGLADLGADVRAVCPVPITREGTFSRRIPGVAERASRFVDWNTMETLPIDDEAALARCRALIRNEGIECGPSGGMNVLAAECIAAARARAGDAVITFLPDRRDIYDFLSDAALGISMTQRFVG